ncbi:MAG: hypothetical protein RLZZ226_438, partial [Pseudomonadota bacterium]
MVSGEWYPGSAAILAARSTQAPIRHSPFAIHT